MLVLNAFSYESEFSLSKHKKLIVIVIISNTLNFKIESLFFVILL